MITIQTDGLDGATAGGFSRQPKDKNCSRVLKLVGCFTIPGSACRQCLM